MSAREGGERIRKRGSASAAAAPVPEAEGEAERWAGPHAPPRGHPRAAAESGGRNERASCFNFSSPSPSSSSRPVFAASFSIYVNEWASDAFATTRNVYTRLHPIHDRRHPPPRQPFAMKRNKIMRTHMVEWNKHGARGIADLLLNLSSKNLKF